MVSQARPRSCYVINNEVDTQVNILDVRVNKVVQGIIHYKNFCHIYAVYYRVW